MNESTYSEERFDLMIFLKYLARWWWLLLFGAAVAGGTAYVVSIGATPQYQSTSKILIQSGGAPRIPTAADIESSQALAGLMSDLILTTPILDAVILDLDLPYGPETLASKLRINSPRSVVEITASDRDPQSAADIANATTASFIDDFTRRQFAQIAQFQASLSHIGIAEDPNVVLAQAGALNAVSVLEEATPASRPSGASTMFDVVVAAIGGLLIAGVVTLGIEYFDDRVRAATEVQARTGLTHLGTVATLTRREDWAFVAHEGVASHAQGEARDYEFLHVNLEFSGINRTKFKTILITSPGSGEGKTTTVANAGAAAAAAGKSVVIVDSDLRMPTLHHYADPPPEKGLTHVILGRATLDEVLAPTSVDGLRLVACGPIPSDPGIVLRSSAMREVIQ